MRRHIIRRAKSYLQRRRLERFWRCGKCGSPNSKDIRVVFRLGASGEPEKVESYWICSQCGCHLGPGPETTASCDGREAKTPEGGAMITFGTLLKQLRTGSRQTLRGFCVAHGFKAMWVSEVERGLVKPPFRSGTLRRLAEAVGLEEGSEPWQDFMQLGGCITSDYPSP